VDVSMPDAPASNPFAEVQLLPEVVEKTVYVAVPPLSNPTPGTSSTKPRRARLRKSVATVRDSDDGIEIVDQAPAKRKSEGGPSVQPSSSK
jgi:hypothetical protein